MTDTPEVFTRIKDAIAIISRRGVFRQCELYNLGNYIYAKWQGGYIQLYYDNTTSVGARVHKLVTNHVFEYDKFNRLIYGSAVVKQIIGDVP
jgi:hypothetical protein